MPVFNNALAGAAGQSGGSGDFSIQKSIRFNSGDSAHLSRTPSSAGNRRVWTWSGWVKKSTITGNTTFFSAGSDGSNRSHFMFDGSDHALRFFDLPESVGLVSDAMFIDTGAWAHFVIAVNTTLSTTSDRIKLYCNGQQITSFSTSNYPGYNAQLQVNRAAEHRIGSGIAYGEYFNGYIAEVNFVDGQQLDPTDFGQVNATTGVWDPKRFTGSYGSNGYRLTFSDSSSNSALGNDAAGSNNWTVNNLVGPSPNNNTLSSHSHTGHSQGEPTSKFLDGDSSTSYTLVATGSNTTTDAVFTFGTSLSGTLEVLYHNGNSQVTGSISIDGGNNYTSLSTTSGATWVSVGTISGNEVRLRCTFNSGGGSTSYWNGIRVNGVNVLTAANESGIDSLRDSPTNYDDETNIGGNFSTLDPLKPSGNAGTYSNGNLDFTRASGYGTAKSTIGMRSGKWYCEVIRGSGNTVLGVMDETTTPDYLDRQSGGYGYRFDGTKVHNNQGHGNIGSYSSTDIVGLGFDADAKAIYFYKNGNLQGSFTGLTSTPSDGTWFFAFSAENTTINVNFGQRPLSYLPTGYKALCTQNFDDPAIENSSDHFAVKKYTGNGGTQTISLPHSPDVVWVKGRSTSYDHELASTLLSANKAVAPNITDAQFNTVIEPGTDSFFLDGTSLYANENNATYISWNWFAGGSTVTNTEGTGSCQLRANPTAGISVATFTGTGTAKSYGHGLNTAPKMVICKGINHGDGWSVYHSAMGNTKAMGLHATSASYTSSVWDNTSPTSTVTRIAGDYRLTGNTNLVLSFAPVEGFSAFGSFTSGSDPFVYTNFRPRFVLLKRSDGVAHWYMFDSERGPVNPNETWLEANESGGEQTHANGHIKFFSNGFQPVGADIDPSGGTFIYAAFGDPFKFSRAR